MNIYCPLCGELYEEQIEEVVVIVPVEFESTCPHCETVWKVKIEFYEVERQEEMKK